MNYLRRRTVLSFIGAGLLAEGLRSAGVLHAEPAEQVLLTVDGSAGEHAFGMSDLDALPQQTFITSTIWTKKPVEFSGPALMDVLKASGIGADGLRLRAANNYSIELDASMVETATPIIATRINGQAFDLRDRGPLWLVFPYDVDSRFRTEKIFAASIWQLTHILSGTSAP